VDPSTEQVYPASEPANEPTVEPVSEPIVEPAGEESRMAKEFVDEPPVCPPSQALRAYGSQVKQSQEDQMIVQYLPLVASDCQPGGDLSASSAEPGGPGFGRDDRAGQGRAGL